MKNGVVIVGAGLSGLRIASLLTRDGIPCRVLEARDRIGGRILTQEVEGRPEYGQFDLGPTWFWPQYEPKITALVEELGLETFVQHNQGRMITERSLQEPPQEMELGVGAMERSARIAGGVHALMRAMADTLPEGIVELNQRVTSIRQGQENRVWVDIDGGRESIAAKVVIMALPPRLITRHIAFEPGLPPELMRELFGKPTWMAAQAKAILVYERPFWREQGRSGFATSRAGPLQEIHDASPAYGAGALFGFFGMDAKTRASLGADRIQSLVGEQLIRLFGPLAADRVATLYKDWSMDSDTAIAEDADPIRFYPNYGPPVADYRSWNNLIHFAGTETARVQGGHLEGALQAADRIVSKVMRRFK